MKRIIGELYQKQAAFQEKYQDPALDELLLGVAAKLEEADVMYHQFAYLLMHIRATVAHQVRPKHLQDAIERAERFLKRHEEENQD